MSVKRRSRSKGLNFKIHGVAACIVFTVMQTDLARAERPPEFGLDQFAKLNDAQPFPVLLIDPASGDITYANPAASEFYGYTREQLDSLAIQEINQLTPEEVANERKRAAEQNRKYFIFQHKLSDGSLRTVEVRSIPITVEGQQLLFSTINDISAQREANAGLWHYQERLERAVEQKRQELETHYTHQRTYLGVVAGLLFLLLVAVGIYARLLHLSRSTVREANRHLRLADQVFENASEGILVTDANARIIRANPAVSKISGYDMEEIIGSNPRIFSSGRQPPAFYKEMWESLSGTGSWSGELWNRTKTGKDYVQRAALAAIRDDDGKTTNYVAVFSDITALLNHQKELEHTAHYDALTQLPNRMLLLLRMNDAIELVRLEDAWGAVLFLDLDGFKTVNDHYGHTLGDELLIAASRRILRHFRTEDTLARLGGDEFVAVVVGLESPMQAEELARRILAEVAKPFELEGTRLTISTSIGVVTFNARTETSPDQLLRQSDAAMYQSKLQGKNRYTVFNPKTELAITTFNNKINALSEAIDNEELIFHFQPKVDVVRGQIHSAEALVRWNHPTDGLRLPGSFLEATEHPDLSRKLDGWTLATAFQTLERWQTAGHSVPLSVNIDPRNLASGWLHNELKVLIGRFETVDPSLLDVEVLESTDATRDRKVGDAILDCNRLGVTFSIDDFGTGYSTLTHLRNLPATHVKIDQSFVQNAINNLEDLAIVEAVLGLATTLNREVIAEGVETKDHQNLLISMGCSLLQGYSLARPLPETHFLSWQAQFVPDPDWARLMSLSKRHAKLLYFQVELRNWAMAIRSGQQPDTPLPCFSGTENLHKIYWPWLNKQGMSLFSDSPHYAVLLQHAGELRVATAPCLTECPQDSSRCRTEVLQLEELADICVSTIDDIILRRPEIVDLAPPQSVFLR
ncbi:hypothetical protein GCM10011316_22160 [Roseibium aquae]|uniref:PAS domain S-box-containing protein/diguanylate cyclase (GGDEF)-like protein n=1 Tax=Roseibium aquae TaxID=1323746 RepID=A0A916X134_9HYPH|nr:bifunctional diguanylate cyclase/phosphodiesterase [Roseibium aquae]GGB49597.1 hypothetical protein GCM10011316_22160 [Roseibium aquae]